LQHWWGGVHAIGDEFLFTADPASKLLEMPVLFKQEGAGGNQGALAYTTDSINSLIDKDRVLHGRYTIAGGKL
jgi:hypothetical protein